MQPQTNHSTARSLSQDEIIQSVDFRFRICQFLFRAAVVWVVIGIVLFAIAFSAGILLSGLSFMAMTISLGLFTAAFAVTLAIYRCPVCDTRLSFFHSEQIDCAGCNVKIK
jgi:hypothetical protein